MLHLFLKLLSFRTTFGSIAAAGGGESFGGGIGVNQGMGTGTGM